MERREFMTTLGAVAALSVSPAFAEEGGKPVHHHPPMYKALMESSAKCVSTGEECLRHCFGMLSMNDTSMADCTKASFDTIAACRALETLASVNSPYAASVAKAVESICLACKKECDKFPQYSECVDMAKSCEACAAECHKVAA